MCPERETAGDSCHDHGSTHRARISLVTTHPLSSISTSYQQPESYRNRRPCRSITWGIIPRVILSIHYVLAIRRNTS